MEISFFSNLKTIKQSSYLAYVALNLGTQGFLSIENKKRTRKKRFAFEWINLRFAFLYVSSSSNCHIVTTLNLLE